MGKPTRGVSRAAIAFLEREHTRAGNGYLVGQ
jgi:hypothetical protein